MEKCDLKKHARKYNEKVQESYPPKPQKVWFRLAETYVLERRACSEKATKIVAKRHQTGHRNAPEPFKKTTEDHSGRHQKSKTKKQDKKTKKKGQSERIHRPNTSSS